MELLLRFYFRLESAQTCMEINFIFLKAMLSGNFIAMHRFKGNIGNSICRDPKTVMITFSIKNAGIVLNLIFLVGT